MMVTTDPESTNIVLCQLFILPLIIVFRGLRCVISCVMVVVWRGFPWLIFWLSRIFDILPSESKCLASALPCDELGALPSFWCTCWLIVAWFSFLRKFISVWRFTLTTVWRFTLTAVWRLLWFPYCVEGIHCVKKARIRSFSGPYFPAFGLNTDISAFSPNAGKYGPEKLRVRKLFTEWLIIVTG